MSYTPKGREVSVFDNGWWFHFHGFQTASGVWNINRDYDASGRKVRWHAHFVRHPSFPVPRRTQ